MPFNLVDIRYITQKRRLTICKKVRVNLRLQVQRSSKPCYYRFFQLYVRRRLVYLTTFLRMEDISESYKKLRELVQTVTNQTLQSEKQEFNVYFYIWAAYALLEFFSSWPLSLWYKVIHMDGCHWLIKIHFIILMLWVTLGLIKKSQFCMNL